MWQAILAALSYLKGRQASQQAAQNQGVASMPGAGRTAKQVSNPYTQQPSQLQSAAIPALQSFGTGTNNQNNLFNNGNYGDFLKQLMSQNQQ